jgi:nitroreductase
MNINEALKERRSIRKFRKDLIPEEILEEVLDTARYAPSWANTQVWEFIVIKEQSTKDALAGTLSPANPSTSAVKEAPVVLVACGKKGVSGFYKGQQSTVIGDWLMFDVALCIATLNLAAHDKGLGMVHVGAFDIPGAASILGVPDDVQVVEILPLGYPDQSPKAPRRKETKEFVHYESYGKQKK